MMRITPRDMYRRLLCISEMTDSRRTTIPRLFASVVRSLFSIKALTGGVMDRRIRKLLTICAFAICAGLQANAGIAESVQQVEAACESPAQTNTPILIMLNDIRAGRAVEAQKMAEEIGRQSLSRAEIDCMNAARLAIGRLRAAYPFADTECSQAERIAYSRCLSPAEKDDIKANADAQRRAAEQPTEQLKTVYRNYIAMQACFESRKEFRVKYVTQQELDTARRITTRDEQALVTKFPALTQQKDALWEEAKQEYGGSNLATSLGISGTTHNSWADQHCKLHAIKYTSDKQHQQQQIKRDF